MTRIYIARHGEPIVHLWTPLQGLDENGHVRAPCGAMTGELRTPNGHPVKVALRATKAGRVNCDACRRAYNLGPRP